MVHFALLGFTYIHDTLTAHAVRTGYMYFGCTSLPRVWYKVLRVRHNLLNNGTDLQEEPRKCRCMPGGSKHFLKDDFPKYYLTY